MLVDQLGCFVIRVKTKNLLFSSETYIEKKRKNIQAKKDRSIILYIHTDDAMHCSRYHIPLAALLLTQNGTLTLWPLP